MIDPNNLHAAADEMLASALLGQSWEASLQLLADATGAGGASLVRIKGGRHAAHVSSTDWSTWEAAAMAGDAPPSQLRYYPERAFSDGFRTDHEVWADEMMHRDAYFQEFLRPRGVFFHAKLRLRTEADDRVTLTLKRRIELGPYERSDIAALDRIAPDLRKTFQVAHHMLDAESSGMVRALLERGDPVFELDGSGRVLRSHGLNNENDPGIIVRGRRLTVLDRQAQAAVDRAIAVAIEKSKQPAFVGITNQHGRRGFLYALPVAGRARDVFLAAAVVVVVFNADRGGGSRYAETIKEVFDLTDREAQIAALLAKGTDPQKVATHLDIGIGTVRSHLKSIFSKTGTRRQSELVALLCPLQR